MPVQILNGTSARGSFNYMPNSATGTLTSPGPSTASVFGGVFTAAGKMYRDWLRFKTPYLVEVSASATSLSWTTDATTTANAPTMFSGRTDLSTSSLSATWPAMRITWNGAAGAYITKLLIGFRVGTGNGTFLWEGSADGTSWTTIHDSVASGSAAFAVTNKWVVLDGTESASGYAYHRLTMLATGTVNLPIACIQGLSQRPGDQGVSEATDTPYGWDHLRNVAFPAELNQQVASTYSAVRSCLLERALPTTVGDTINIGTIANPSGATGCLLAIDVVLAGTPFIAVKRYSIPFAYSGSGTWQVVRPVQGNSNTTTQDFQLEINVSAGVGTLRLRRTAGSTAAVTAAVHVEVLNEGYGYSAAVFTPDATTTSAPAAATGVYTAAAFNLLDKVSALSNAGATLTLGDPTLFENNIRATLDQSCVVRLPGHRGTARYVSGRSTYTAASITGDIDIRAQLNPTSWQGSQVIATKDGTTSGTRGWQFALTTAGNLQFQWSTAGVGLDKVSAGNGSLPFAAGQVGWVRVTLAVATGVVAFYYSRDGVNWTAWGGSTVGAASIFNNSGVDYWLAQSSAGTSQYSGDISSIDIRSGIGGTTMLPSDPTTWTLVGTVSYYAATTAPPVGSRVKLALQQDATGGRTVRWSPNVLWPNGTPPTLSVTPGAVDYFEFDWVDGANWYARPLTQDAPATKSNIQKFTSSGIWYKPAAAVTVEVRIMPPGGGGGSGRRGAAGTVRQGGGAGGGGALTTVVFDAADLPTFLSVAIGAPGTGGAAVATNDIDGSSGGNGGACGFHSVSVNGGTGGVGGSTGAAGTGGAAAPGHLSGSAGGSASATGGAGGNSGPSAAGASGGGAGGGITTSNTAGAGGGSYGPAEYSAGTLGPNGGAAGADGGSGVRSPSNMPQAGLGGGGGGANTSGAGGAGGAGSMGGGGGGGGASANGNASGAGGAGGSGAIWVISRF